MNPGNTVKFSDEEYFLFLQKLYQWGPDLEDCPVSLWAIAEQLQYSDVDAQQIADQLQKKSMLTFVSLAGKVQLTSLGRFAVMIALSNPDQSSHFFPAIAEFSNIEKSQISFGHISVSGFVKQLREFSSELNLSEDTSDKLSQLFVKLENTMCRTKSGSNRHVVVRELQAIDQLLNVNTVNMKFA